MQEVTCSHCGRHVQITPDAPRCSLCGEDLQPLLVPLSATAYFYRRSADLAARGDLEGALAEAERGIDYHDASELRLLAAILSKRMGDMGTVRFHVAAIPVDDRLRQEAEWLIRAQPPRGAETSEWQRKPATLSLAPQEADTDTPSEASGAPALNAAPSALEGTNLAPGSGRASARPGEVPDRRAATADAPASNEGSRGGVWVQRMWAAVAVALLVVAGAMGWLLLSGGPDALLALLPGASLASTAAPEAAAPLAPITPAPLVLPSPTPQGTPTVPADLVSLPAAAAIADSSMGALARANRFDLPAALTAAGRADLAALPLAAQLEGGAVKVTGIVTNTTYREAVVETVAAVHGVTDVNASELLVRVPATYTVSEGDTLWQIVTFYYGTDAAGRVAELYTLNSDVLPSASALQVGMEIKLPAVD